jgi:hypothetical protein
MSHATIARAATDLQLRDRVTAAAHREIVFNEALAATQYGQALIRGLSDVTALMWPVAVETEAAYEAAVVAGRGAPGHDTDVITDAALTSAVVASWPPDPPAMQSSHNVQELT